MRISDWSSDVCSSDLLDHAEHAVRQYQRRGTDDRREGVGHDPRPAATAGGRTRERLTRENPTREKTRSATMALYEMRTYTLYVGKMAEAVAVYREFPWYDKFADRLEIGRAHV